MSGSLNDSIGLSSIMDKEERTVDLYITAETVRDLKHKKEVEESDTTITTTTTTSTKPPEHTGSESVKIRRYRSATVCLVLLCVLLLTAVIVLCVLINTNNQQFNIKTKNITEERDQLLTKYTNITEERDQLLTNNTNLTEERDQLLTNNTNITRERDELIAKNKNITKRREQFNKLHKDMYADLFVFTVGWIYYQSSLYFISSEQKSWTESRRYCTERGADLIIINNKEEQDFVRNISNAETIWIGLTDSAVEGTWKWVDDSTLSYTFWANKQPNSATEVEDYVESSSAGWNDQPSYFNRKWICEINMFI
nr:CD209 antigen-like protein C [Misgurnus anguillicaudatus]